jgi:hypothetical protein
MGSVADLSPLKNKCGELLPQLAIAELKEYNFEVVLRHESSEDVYRDAINRFNKAWIRDAVMLTLK